MSVLVTATRWKWLLLGAVALSGCPAPAPPGLTPSAPSATPISTPAPATASPVPVNPATPQPAPVPRPTLSASPAPAPDAAPASSAAPTATPLPSPTSAASPTPTPQPTPTATPVPAPDPTPSPSAEASAAPVTLSKAFHSSGLTLGPGESEAELLARGVPSVASGSTRFFIGYQQVSANNQNPVLVRFDQGVQTWLRSDYESSGDDSRGYGLLWDGGTRLYAVFSSTGSQGDSSQDFRRFAQQGWLRSYGAGGGPKVAVLARIEAASGEVTAASFVSARLSNGNSNSLQINDLTLQSESLQVSASAWYSPRNPDTSPMRCSGSSPFAYSLNFSLDLRQVLQASAENCTPE